MGGPPADLRAHLKDLLWRQADAAGWMTLSDQVKTIYYDTWTRDPAIGGVLAAHMDPSDVRTFLKYVLFKNYTRDRLGEPDAPFAALGVRTDAPVQETFVHPHGRLLRDGRLVCWGRADDWQSVLFAMHERAYARPGAARWAAVLMYATARCPQTQFRGMVEDAARLLRIERTVWLD